MRCAGLDLGTTKISAVLIDTDPPPGRVLAVVSREHGAGIAPARPFEHLQDPERILAAAQEALRELNGPSGPAGREAARWDGVCVTGQMHGVLYADAQGQAVSPLMSWLDNRAGQPHPAGGSWAQRLSEAAGRPIAAGYGAATHFYNRHHGLVPPRAAYLCAVMDWVTWRLTGGPAGSQSAGAGRPVTDATIAASVGLADPLTGRPDPRALRESALDGLRPSEVVEAGTRVGSTAGGAGLPGGVPVFAPLGDNQAAFLGAVREVEAMALLNVGTGGQISAWLPALPDEAGGAVEAGGAAGRGLEARPFPGGGLLLVGATLCAGRAYALLEEFFRAVLEAFGGRAEEALYERMNALAGDSEAGGEGGPLVDTRFNGTREDPRITGSIEGLTLRNLTPAALVRGFLAGIAGELHGRYAALVGLRAAAPGGLVGSGNGLRRNPALRAEISRRCGLPLRLPRLREEAALGAALAAAVGLGRYPGFRAAGQIIRYEDEEDFDS